jgi:hypothetical protein
MAINDIMNALDAELNNVYSGYASFETVMQGLNELQNESEDEKTRNMLITAKAKAIQTVHTAATSTRETVRKQLYKMETTIATTNAQQTAKNGNISNSGSKEVAKKETKGNSSKVETEKVS